KFLNWCGRRFGGNHRPHYSRLSRTVTLSPSLIARVEEDGSHHITKYGGARRGQIGGERAGHSRLPRHPGPRLHHRRFPKRTASMMTMPPITHTSSDAIAINAKSIKNVVMRAPDSHAASTPSQL